MLTENQFSPYWQQLTDEQIQKCHQVLAAGYGEFVARQSDIIERGIIYPGNQVPSPLEVAHTNLLSVYLAKESAAIGYEEHHQFGSFVAAFEEMYGTRLVFFAQAGVGRLRYTEKIKESIRKINNSLRPLTDGQNLIPELI